MRIILAFSILLLSLVVQANQFATDYELVAASQTDQICGPGTSATKRGDILEKLIIVPETTGAGTVAIQDGDATAINVFVSGTLSDLHPIIIPINARSVTGSWSITTGANVHAICVGQFK